MGEKIKGGVGVDGKLGMGGLEEGGLGVEGGRGK